MTNGRPGHGWQLYTTHLGMKGDNSPSFLILRIFIVVWKLPRLLVCCLPPGGLTIPPFMRNQDSIRERQLELFKLYIFFFPSLHLPSFLLIQLIKSDQGCSEFSAQSFRWRKLVLPVVRPWLWRSSSTVSIYLLVQMNSCHNNKVTCTLLCTPVSGDGFLCLLTPIGLQ